jgi:hypothetical protein
MWGPCWFFRSGNRYGDEVGPRARFSVCNPSASKGISVERIEPPDNDPLAPFMGSRGVIDPTLFSRRVPFGVLEVVSKGAVLAVGIDHDLTRCIKVYRLKPGEDGDGYPVSLAAAPGAALGDWQAGGMQLAFLVDCLQLNAEGNSGEFLDDAGKMRAAVRNPGAVSCSGKPDAFRKVPPRRGQRVQRDVLEEGVVGERADDTVFHDYGFRGAERGQGVHAEQHGNGNSHMHLLKVVSVGVVLEYPYTCFSRSFKKLLLPFPIFSDRQLSKAPPLPEDVGMVGLELFKLNAGPEKRGEGEGMVGLELNETNWKILKSSRQGPALSAQRPFSWQLV